MDSLRILYGLLRLFFGLISPRAPIIFAALLRPFVATSAISLPLSASNLSATMLIYLHACVTFPSTV
jgi:hypothetical protein